MFLYLQNRMILFKSINDSLLASIQIAIKIAQLQTMKVNIKNLKGEIFSIEIEPTQTISVLKQRIEAQKGIAAQAQKIIFKGKTTSNQDQIQKLGLKQTDFLVVMAQVAKPQPKPKVEEKVEGTVPKVQEKKEEKKEEKKDNSTSSASNEAQINQLMSMGFPRQQCIAALRAAYNDSSRAVEYLLNGIPLQTNENQRNSSNPLSALMVLPQFEQMRALIQSDSSALPQLLSQIAQTSPELYNIIAQHPEQFQRLVIQGDDAQQGQGDQFQGQQGNEGEVVVTQEQDAAIMRLAGLGFSKIEAAQAYLACDKNEQMAANLLFDRLANGDIEQSYPQQGGSHQEDDDNLFN